MSRPDRAPLRQHLNPVWPILLLALLLTILVGFAAAEPLERLFRAQAQLDRLLVLVLGVLYLGLRALATVHAALLVIVFVLVGGTALLLRSFWRRYRRAALVFVAVLLIGNWVVVGAPGWLMAGRVLEPVTDCEYYLTQRPQTGIRIVRYPVVRLSDEFEHQFYLITHDGGATWSQFMQFEARMPEIRGCDNIEFVSADEGTITIDSLHAPTMTYRLTTYRTVDGGLTWQRSDGS